MSNNSLVSVIIPAYNAEPYIEETVNRVLQQTHKNLELIIVNDGSTDNTLTKLKDLEKTDTRISVLTKENSGVCDSRNLGLEKAKGNYLTFLDADDVWEPTFLEECLNRFNSENTPQAVYTKVQMIDEHSSKVEDYIEAKTISSASDVLEWKQGYVASMGCTVYTKHVVEQAGIFDKRLSTAADQDFHLRIAAITPIVAIDKVLFYYRIHNNNMHSNISVMEKDHILVFKKAADLGLYHSFWFKQKCFSKLYMTLAGSWWKNGKNKLRGLYFLVKSLLSHPIYFFKLLAK